MSYRGSFRGRGRGSGSGSGSNTRFTGKRRGRGGGGGGGGGGVAYGIDRRRPAAPSNQATREDGTAATERFEEVKVYDEIDEKIGFWRFESVRAEGEEKIGWLVNMHQVSCSVWCECLIVVLIAMVDSYAERCAPWRSSCCRLLFYSR